MEGMRVDKSSCLLFRAFISTVTFLEGSSAVTLPNPVIDCIIVLKICANIAKQLIIDNEQFTINWKKPKPSVPAIIKSVLIMRLQLCFIFLHPLSTDCLLTYI